MGVHVQGSLQKTHEHLEHLKKNSEKSITFFSFCPTQHSPKPQNKQSKAGLESWIQQMFVSAQIS